MPLSGPGRQLTVHRPSQKKKGRKKEASVTVIEQVPTEPVEIHELPDAPALLAHKEKVGRILVQIGIEPRRRKNKRYLLCLPVFLVHLHRVISAYKCMSLLSVPQFV